MIEDFKKYYESKTSSKTDGKNLDEIADRLIWMASKTSEMYSTELNAKADEIAAMLYYRSEEERNEILRIIEQKNKNIHSTILLVYENVMKQPNAKELLTKATTKRSRAIGEMTRASNEVSHNDVSITDKDIEKFGKIMKNNFANQIPEEYKNLPIKDDDGMGQK